jgi:hypothetical protein
MRVARSRDANPLSVSEILREVRCSKVVPSRCSSRVTALETVALERLSSLAAAEKEPCSATLAKIAHASKSGR